MELSFGIFFLKICELYGNHNISQQYIVCKANKVSNHRVMTKGQKIGYET